MWIIPENNAEGRVFMSIALTFLVMAWISFCIRVYAKRITHNNLDASDYTCFCGLLLSVGVTVILWAVYSHGWGLDVQFFTIEYQIFAGKLFVAILIIWNTAVSAIRISILLFYIRIFAVTKFRWAFIAVTILNVAELIAVLVASLTICQPISYAFNPTTPGGHCGNTKGLQKFTTYWSLVTDVTIVSLPMPILWSLNMRTRKKIGLVIIMGMGIIICAMTLTRVVLSVVYQKNNITRQNAPVVFITAMEPLTGVINACLPHFPPVWRQMCNSQWSVNLCRIMKIERSTGMIGNSSGTWVPSNASMGRRERSFRQLQDRPIHLTTVWGKRKHEQDEESLSGIHVRKDIIIDNSSALKLI
ncbi:hypothetical protein P154DRAFT_604424 [Amniculicola lignicola CBS 123094]|uniref:Rhodopsin domain-containing protein n=1 Tax=Amniculicola lignicola CBS 123094 TaxID=1392246 RepID=A0A6A5WAH1_9PLEO|nr:hypothetical protein P154DRAFT_604424 [Amniculicola lignicola CBS 123094]